MTFLRRAGVWLSEDNFELKTNTVNNIALNDQQVRDLLELYFHQNLNWFCE